ncbi:MAG TPA: hypothetical protein VKB34_22670, partial [Povalibacter sp.]|nr:hypothetical protein [Povalibacter sp.]
MTTPSHTVITRESARHAIVGATILVAHAVVFYGLLSLGPKLQSQTERPVEVRFIAEAPLRQRSEPPQVKVVTPVITAPVPELPVLESPVMPASEHAISVPVQTPVVARTAPVDGDAPKLISSVEYLREPLPRYPPQSRKLREQGLVVLRVLIDEKG